MSSLGYCELSKFGNSMLFANNDFIIKLEDAKAALVAAQGNFEVSKADIGSALASVSVSDANVQSAGGTIETAKIRLGRATNDFERYNNLYKNYCNILYMYIYCLCSFHFFYYI